MSLELYTKNNCIQCKMTKKFLTEHNISFGEKNITETPEYIDYLKNKGFRSVPVLEDGNQPIINGFRPDLLKKLIAQ
ncbi:glutaredoxin-like protein NrdH [Ligilactobacillus acidipiscis]|uniref:Glutaredoxin-like protein NrdH n=2 Tax=Ligilactobacillus acidipiscis TaxID=89059 RepID=A0A1K1KMX7_9LACO|nr:glutaredoxin-like protein NrdH [Ligilactobacillus acidipiscis]SFV40213.1 Glutaredoxin-like protein NrdH, required for reduction of Ribonucleotide reductase class Ib [Ligilactobacillus acidipiscis]